MTFMIDNLQMFQRQRFIQSVWNTNMIVIDQVVTLQST